MERERIRPQKLDSCFSEPGLLLVFKIGNTEFLGEHLLFFADADHLQRNQHHKAEQVPWLSGPEDRARDRQPAKDIDRIANPRVEPGGHERTGFGLHAEGASELNAGQHEERERRDGNGQSNNARRSERKTCGVLREEQNSYKNDKQCGEIRFQPFSSRITAVTTQCLPNAACSISGCPHCALRALDSTSESQARLACRYSMVGTKNGRSCTGMASVRRRRRMLQLLLHWVLSALAADRLAPRARFLCAWPRAGDDRFAGDRPAERNGRPVSEDHHLSIDHSHPGDLPAGDQWNHDPGGIESCAGISRA